MKSRISKGYVFLTRKRILGLAGLASLALICAGPSRAQVKPEQPTATVPPSSVAEPATSPGVQSSSATPVLKQTSAQHSTAGSSAPKGQSEGINVHGHWTIEVRNPDGKVVSHTEFENALSPGFSFPLPNNFIASSVQLPGGSALLSAVMTGQAVMTPENWAILLEGPNGLAGTGGAPCTPIDGAQFYGTCFLFPSATDNVFSGPICPIVNGTPSPGPIGYSCNLAVSPLGTGPNFTGFQLSGTVVAMQPGTISSVVTMNFGVCGPTDTLANCPFASSSDGFAAFTARNLDGNTAAGAAAGDPNPVSVTAAGQTISVTVAVSFQ
jgi:hypothetical protein